MRYLARCGDGEVLRSGTKFLPPLDVAGRKRFEDGGSYSFGLGNGERARARTHVRGQARVGSLVGRLPGAHPGHQERALRDVVQARQDRLDG